MTTNASPHQPAGKSASSRRWKARRWIGYGLFLVLFVGVYTHLGALFILGANVDPGRDRQQVYVEGVLAFQSYQQQQEQESGKPVRSFVKQAFPHFMTDEVQPFWPWLLRGETNVDSDQLFLRGKWLNFSLTLIALLVFGILAAEAFSFMGAVVTVLIMGFGMLLQRSCFFHEEALLLIGVVTVWMVILSLLRENSLWHYSFLGLAMGLTFLVHPQIWTIVAAFILVSLARGVEKAVRLRRVVDRAERGWSNPNHVVGVSISLAVFLLVAGPRLAFSAETFGSPFFSQATTAAYAISAQVTPAGEVPGEHSGFFGKIAELGLLPSLKEATTNGWQAVKESVLWRQAVLLGYAIFVVIVIGLLHQRAYRRQSLEVWKIHGTSAFWMFGFTIVCSLVTFLVVGFGVERYPPLIAVLDSLFLPVLLTCFWLAERFRRQLTRAEIGSVANQLYFLLMLPPAFWVGWRVVQGIASPLT